MDYKTAGDKLANYLNIQTPDLEGEIAEVMDKALNALDECAKGKGIKGKTVKRITLDQRELALLDLVLQYALSNIDGIEEVADEEVEKELSVLKAKLNIPLDELADEVVLPEMLTYAGDKLSFEEIVEKAHHADHRANAENVREALNHLEQGGAVIKSRKLGYWIALRQ